MYRSQVDRLSKELADAEKRAAGERSLAVKMRGDALRAQSSITRSTTGSVLASKLRDINRKEEQAAAHEKRAAQHAEQAAGKRRQLSAAQSSLERATTQERQKDERESRRRREVDLRHIQELERVRRSAPGLGFASLPAFSESPRPTKAGARESEYEFDVCLSFAGENRDYVEMVNSGLKQHDIVVFYDEDAKTKLWGKNLTEHFDYIYRKASRYCVMFISEHYALKPWTRYERRSALARALEESDEYILPARFDETELDGLPPTVAYLDLREIAPSTLVEHIIEKIGRG